jgi:hypothetical protein
VSRMDSRYSCKNLSLRLAAMWSGLESLRAGYGNRGVSNSHILAFADSNKRVDASIDPVATSPVQGVEIA